jgi:hypothetical protein
MTTAVRPRPKSEDILRFEYQQQSPREAENIQSSGQGVPAAKDNTVVLRPLKQQHEAQSSPSLSGTAIPHANLFICLSRYLTIYCEI